MFNFSGSTHIGTASAKVEVDLSQPRQAVGQMRTIAQQITQSLTQINRVVSQGTGTPNAFGVTTTLNKQMQEEAKAAQKLAQQRQRMIEESRPKTIPEFDSFTKSLTANRFGVVAALDKEMQAEAQAAQRLQRQREQSLRAMSKPNAFGVVTQLDPGLQQIGKTAQNLEQQRVSQDRASERNYRQQVLAEIRQTQQVLSEARAQVNQAQQRFNVVSTRAPSGTDRSSPLGALAEQRSTISDVQARLAALRGQIESLSPRQQIALIPQLRQLQEEASRAATGGMQRLNASISQFEANVNRSRSGVQGYFTMVRENLERINETSLAANLQEISFRLLPLGLASGAAVRQGLQTSESLQETRISMEAFTGSETEAISLMRQLTEQAHRFGLPMVETLTVMQRFAPLIRQAGLDLNDTINIAARLATLNPAQGIEGALYAINEALAGQWRSLQFRFNIPTENLRNLIAEKGFIGGLDEFLNKLGRTTEFAEKFGNTTRASFTKLTDSINNLLSSALDPFIDTITSAIDSVTAFFNNLASTAPAITGVVGAILLLITTMTTMLITLGQVALGLNAIKALFPQTAAAATAAAGEIAVANGVIGASTGAGAAGGAGGLLSRAGTVAGGVARAGVVGAVALGGVAVGTNVAAGLGIPGINNPADAIQRLVQIITAPVLGLAFVFELLKDTFENGVGVVGAALQNIGTIIGAGAGLLGDVLQHLGAVISKAIGTIEGVIGNALVGIADQFKDVFDTSGVRAAGEATLLSADTKILNADRILADPILSFYERTRDRLIDISNLPFLPTDAQLREAHDNASRRWVEANNTISTILGFFGLSTQTIPLPETPPAGGDAGGGLTGGGGTKPGLDEETLQRAYELLVNNMIQTTRQAADEALAMQREGADFLLGRVRAFIDFARQQAQALEDFNRDRAQRIDDFNRQIADEEKQAEEQRQKQLEDYRKEEERRQQDHLRDMIRAARDVDDAISGRNFLAAQQALQKMRDQQEDFDTETKRRKEDFDEQQKDLDDNLRKQQEKRQDDFQRQLRQMDDNFQRQQQRQQQEFSLRLAREDYDRALRQQREEQDRQIRRQRQQQDFDIQLAQLDSHNNTMEFIWQYGLGRLRDLTLQFWASFGAAIGGGSGGGAGRALPTPFADGGMVTRTGLALVHRNEVIYEPAGRLPFGGGPGFDPPISVTIDARGSAMSKEEWIDLAENRIVPRIVEELEKRRRRIG